MEQSMKTTAPTIAMHGADQELVIRRIEPRDDAAIAHIIRTVMTEFGACGAGYSITDTEVDHMYEAYSGGRAAYFVVCDSDRVLGGGGVAPLKGAGEDVCELRKMYFLSEARGTGMGRAMLEQCLTAARSLGFKQCYLETLGSMDRARRLYDRAGFRKIRAPMGNTGHFKCDAWYVLDL